MTGRVRHRITRVPSGKAYEREKPAKPKAPFAIDWDFVAALDNAPNGITLSPKGACYDCDRPVSGERRFCGPCLNKHNGVAP